MNLNSWIGSTIRWYAWYYCVKKSNGYWADVIGIHDQPIWVWWFSSIINNHKLWHRYYFIQRIFGRFFFLLFDGSIVCVCVCAIHQAHQFSGFFRNTCSIFLLFSLLLHLNWNKNQNIHTQFQTPFVTLFLQLFQHLGGVRRLAHE